MRWQTLPGSREQRGSNIKVEILRHSSARVFHADALGYDPDLDALVSHSIAGTVVGAVKR